MGGKHKYYAKCKNCGKGMYTGGVAYSGLCQKCFKRFNITNPHVTLNGTAYIRDEQNRRIIPSIIKIVAPIDLNNDVT